MATTYTVVVDSDNMVVPSKPSSHLKILSISEVSALRKLTTLSLLRGGDMVLFVALILWMFTVVTWMNRVTTEFFCGISEEQLKLSLMQNNHKYNRYGYVQGIYY